jgi:hypothetical protein
MITPLPAVLQGGGGGVGKEGVKVLQGGGGGVGKEGVNIYIAQERSIPTSPLYSASFLEWQKSHGGDKLFDRGGSADAVGRVHDGARSAGDVLMTLITLITPPQ